MKYVSRFIMSVTASAIVLLGCSGDENEAKEIVLRNISNPESAEFGDFTIASQNYGDDIIFEGACLSVDYRDHTNIYTGERQALLIRREGERWEFEGFFDKSHRSCVYELTK